MEFTLSLIGVVLSVAQLIPIFTVRNQGKKVVLTIMAGVLFTIFAVLLWGNWRHSQKVEDMKQDVIAELQKGPKPWDSVFENMYDTDFEATNEAFDKLEAEGRLHFEWATVTDEANRKFRVKVYSISAKP